MGKQITLSSLLTRMRAELCAGVQAGSVLRGLEQWILHREVRRPATKERISAWANLLWEAGRSCEELGAPFSLVVTRCLPLVRREERLGAKLSGTESQFAFQAAIVIVVPWVLVAFSSSRGWNSLYWVALGFQAAGVLSFVLLLRRARRAKRTETAIVSDFATRIWIQTLSGRALPLAIRQSMGTLSHDAFSTAWKKWDAARSAGACEVESFRWPEMFVESSLFSSLLDTLAKSGAPASEVIETYVTQAQEEQLDLWEAGLAKLPTLFSLCFVVFFAPAIFVVLVGILWTDLAFLTMT